MVGLQIQQWKQYPEIIERNLKLVELWCSVHSSKVLGGSLVWIAYEEHKINCLFRDVAE